MPVVTEGSTFEELQDNIRDAVALYFKGDDPASLALDRTPTILTNFEVSQPVHAGGIKVLSAAPVIDILAGFGVIGGKKHIELRRAAANGDETLIVPSHSFLAKGTLRAIFSQASRYIPQGELRPHFYNEIVAIF
jgi:hypothetical protein